MGRAMDPSGRGGRGLGPQSLSPRRTMSMGGTTRPAQGPQQLR